MFNKKGEVITSGEKRDRDDAGDGNDDSGQKRKFNPAKRGEVRKLMVWKDATVELKEFLLSTKEGVVEGTRILLHARDWIGCLPEAELHVPITLKIWQSKKDFWENFYALISATFWVGIKKNYAKGIVGKPSKTTEAGQVWADKIREEFMKGCRKNVLQILKWIKDSGLEAAAKKAHLEWKSMAGRVDQSALKTTLNGINGSVKKAGEKEEDGCAGLLSVFEDKYDSKRGVKSKKADEVATPPRKGRLIFSPSRNYRSGLFPKIVDEDDPVSAARSVLGRGMKNLYANATTWGAVDVQKTSYIDEVKKIKRVKEQVTAEYKNALETEMSFLTGVEDHLNGALDALCNSDVEAKMKKCIEGRQRRNTYAGPQGFMNIFA